MGVRTETRSIHESKEVVVGWNCDRCQIAIEPAYPSDDYPATNPKDALSVSFDGYYGGYFDCLREGPRWILCKGCADSLLEAFPFFAKGLEHFLEREFGGTDQTEKGK